MSPICTFMHSELNISELNETAHVWYCSFSENEGNLPEFEPLLATDEKRRASKFKFKKDRNSYIIARGILRTLLGKYVDEKPADLQFEYTSYGKPYLPNNSLNFNVSHSGDGAVFAFVSGSEIGVDIERVKVDFDAMALAQSFFSKTEITALNTIAEKQVHTAFFRCWTRKEAFIKAEGSGLSFPLDQFAVTLHTDTEAQLLETKWDASEKSQWSLFSFVPTEGYLGALAIKKPSFTMKRFNWNNSQFFTDN